jgi:hypothetical protein
VNGFTSFLKNAWEAWTRFWFLPAEPTTFGFIRVVTGLLVVYTHLVYCFDLQGFFGKNAWFDLDTINRERKEYPHVISSWLSWEEYVPSVKIPNQPHRKQAIIKWYRSIPEKKTARNSTLNLLKLPYKSEYDDITRQLLFFAQTLKTDLENRQKQLDGVVDENKRDPSTISQYPSLWKSIRKNDIEDYRNILEKFYDTLPRDDDDKKYILQYLTELNSFSRNEVVSFILELPEDEAERKAQIDYLEYWSFEKKKAHRLGHPIYSVWFHVTDPLGMNVAHGLAILVMILFTLGLWTRVTSVLTWFAAMGYINRSQHVLFGMDTMSNILLIYLFIGNSGGAFSLDRVIARYRAVRKSIKQHGMIDAATAAFLEKPTATVQSGFALRLLQIHFCFIYMAAGLSKLKGSSWWGHGAYWDTTANPEFTMIYFEWYEEAMRALARIRPLYSIVAAIAIAHTFIAEIGLPFMIWTKVRPWIFVIGCLLHAGIAIFMGLTVFSLLMMLMLLSYIPGYAIRKRIFGLPSKKKTTVYFNPQDPAQVSFAAKAVAIDIENGVVLSQDTTVTKDNIKGQAEKILRHSFMAWLKWIPGSGMLTKFWLLK